MKWEDKSLDELGFVSRGRSRYRPRDAEHLYGGIYPFIQTSDVKHSGLYINSFSQTYSEEGLAQSKLWKAGTLCITIAANIADTAILEIDACFPDSIIGFIPDPNKADVRFIKYLFDAQLQRRFKQFTQGAAQDNLSQSKLLSLKLPVPSINIQNKIADILSRYDETIANNRRRIELLERSSRLLYREWFVHLRYPGHEHGAIDLDGIPEGWERKKISTLGEIITGKTPSKKKESNFGGNIPFVKTPDMHDKIVVLKTQENLSEEGANSQSTKYLPRGSIMVSCIGTVGVVSMVAIPCQTNQQINSIIFDNPSLSYFGFFALKDLKPKLEAIGGGATMANVNKQKFGSLEILVPPKQFLILFQQNSESIFKKIENLYLQNQKLQSARDLLLPRLMNGEINV